MSPESAPQKLLDVPTLKILLVEDDGDARENMRDILELDNHHVTTRGSFSEALSLSNLDEFDAIILDRKLPDGMVEVRLPQFRAQAPKTDLIVVTGYADMHASITALREGVTDYIIKPIDPKSLLRSLQHIARRRDAERELQKEHQFAEMVLQTAEAIILVLDRQGRIERMNDYLADLTGQSLSDVYARDWFDTFIPRQDRDRVRKLFHLTIQEESSRGVLNPIITKRGEQRQIRWSNTTIKDDTGGVVGVLSVGLDVTELIAAERKARQSERLATIGSTMAGMAHESRNALQRIRNSVELLEDELAGQQEALRYVEKISRAGNDLLDLLEEVRSYAAPIRLDLESVSLKTVWRHAWESLIHQHSAATLIEVIDDTDVPAILVDARRMEQVFRNLFENAFDACGPDAEVMVRYAMEDDKVTFRVRDNGPGMADEVRASVFEAFYTTKSSGTGLGMAIVDRIIEAHGGTIEVTDATPGTEFLISLPHPHDKQHSNADS